jgi:hypothetical protein
MSISGTYEVHYYYSDKLGVVNPNIDKMDSIGGKVWIQTKLRDSFYLHMNSI